MANPTFDINDLVAPVGRKPPYPFKFPSTAQQAPRTVGDKEDLNSMLGQQPETAILQNAPPGPSPPPAPSPTPPPQPKRRPYAT